MKFICVLLAVLLLVGAAVSHQYGLGACPPEVPFKQHLDVDKFLGQWFVIQMSSTSASCIKFNLTRNGEDLRMVTYIRYGLLAKALDHTIIDTATLKIVDQTEPAKMKLKYSLYTWWEDFTVMDTDYETYASAFSCVSFIGTGYRRNSLILSRKPYLENAIAHKLRRSFEVFGADSSPSFIDHKPCSGLLRSKSDHDRIISVGPLNINRDPKDK